MVACLNKYLINFNTHTHSSFCDGKGELTDYLDFGIQNGIQTLGFSSHAPILFENHFSIHPNRIQEYVSQIRGLDKQHPEIQLFAALECDYIPHFSLPFAEFKEKHHLDYLIGGVHLVENTNSRQLWFIDGPLREEYDRGLREVFGNDIRKGVTQYFHQVMEMIETQNFEILAHLDKIKMHNAGRYFLEEDSWYKKLCMETIDLLKNRDIIVEINTRGIYKKRCPDFYPSRFILENLLENKIRITVNSDAHQPEELRNLLDDAALFAKNIGFKEVWKPSPDHKWVPFPI